MEVLGVDVGERVLRSWRRWLAPDVQPFFVESTKRWPRSVGDGPLSAEQRDTYKVWRIAGRHKTLWLDEATFEAMPRSRRAELVRSQVRIGRGAVPTVRRWSGLIDAERLRTQADGHRFVWWSSLTTSAVVTQVVAEGGAAKSRHDEVAETTWTGCAEAVPGARRLAGTFPRGSGPNCFGTVMAGAGVRGAAESWMQQQPFLEWLAGAADRLRRPDDDRPGTVLVWRDRTGSPVHAAVTIGDGWVFEKPSQEWSTPRAIVAIGDAIRLNRSPGLRLERHRLR